MTRLTKSFSFALRPKSPYNFDLTVRKPAGWDLFSPFEVFESGELSTALHIDGVLVGLNLKSEGTTDSPRILATAFLRRNPSRARKRRVKESLASMLGVEDDLTEFYAMARGDEILKHALDDLRGMHDTYSGTVFSAAVLAICLQMAPLKRSTAMMRCVIEKYGEPAEFDGKRVLAWPLPQAIAKLAPEQLARECRLGYRAKLIVKLADALVKTQFPTMRELARLPSEAAKERLMELPGIGDYSADIINPGAGFPIDAWSVDVFGKLFYGKEPRNARRAVERVKAEGMRRWGRWSWMAFFYIAQDLENLSRKLGVRLRLE